MSVVLEGENENSNNKNNNDDSFYKDDQSLFEGDDDDEGLGLQSTQGSARIAREDIRLMNVVRAIVMLCLLTFAFISGETIFIVSLIGEENDFSDAYDDTAKVLTNTMLERLSQKIWIAKAFAKELAMSIHDNNNNDSSSNELSNNSPFVSFDHFETRCKAPLHLSETTSITFSPFVGVSQRLAWEEYATTAYSLIDNDNPFHIGGSSLGLTTEGIETTTTTTSSALAVSDDDARYHSAQRGIQQGIYRFSTGVAQDEDFSSRGYFPVWQQAPILDSDNDQNNQSNVMFNLLSSQARASGLQTMLQLAGTSISKFLYQDSDGDDYAIFATPRSAIYAPVLQTNNWNGDAAGNTADSIQTIGAVEFEFRWESLFANVLEGIDHALVAVVENMCDSRKFSYEIIGDKVSFLGEGDDYMDKVDGYVETNSTAIDFEALFMEHALLSSEAEIGFCSYQVSYFPSMSFKKHYVTNSPDAYRGIVLAVFLFLIIIFWLYDGLIERRQGNVIKEAEKSDAIVRSLFPSTFRDRLYEESQAKKKAVDDKDAWRNPEAVAGTEGGIIETPKNRLKSFMSKSPEDQAASSAGSPHQTLSEPMADLFPQTTIMFADISGFTAWSSEREPSQVFKLLESIYQQMDRAAKKLGVFKVETVGDCYVAATGIPDPQPHYGAEIMVRFARTCLIRMNSLTKELESQLGPGTAELTLRIGMHSGPVTAGVLRGQKARFQLFGDTMNTASRMESTGQRNKIQLSPDTANILIKNGRGDWLTQRHDKVQVKGKGLMTTYWLLLKTSSQSHASSISGPSVRNGTTSRKSKSSHKKKNHFWKGTELDGVLGQTDIDDDIQRLVNWNADVLLILLKRVITARVISGVENKKLSNDDEKRFCSSGLVLDDFQLVINMPEFDAEVASRMYEEDVELVPEVEKELIEYVTAIASGYKKNSFHNFEHASHVILSANKLLKRIMAADDCKPLDNALTCKELHNHTYGIGTDPLTQFAVVFSALIHDVGHEGVPNFVLGKEHPLLAEKYSQKSIAEQRSVDVAWDLLLLPHFAHLRAAIYQSKKEYTRFRYLVVNGVMGTDIFDKQLKQLRDSRWETAFHTTQQESACMKESMDRKATIVIEHIIQASDVAHTMQHFFIYSKWNERLFQEMYFGFLAGRLEKDPSTGWYEGEIWFFDNYVIPLARKLKECAVFGVSSDEYLNYALQNRLEWERKGKDLCEIMKSRAQKEAKQLGLIEGLEKLLGGDSPDFDSCELSIGNSSFDTSFDTDFEDNIEEFRPDIVDKIADDVLQALRDSALEPPKNRESIDECSRATSKRSVRVPAGKLGIVIDASEEGPVVQNVDVTSPVKGRINPGDRIVAIDGIDMDGKTREEIAALMASGVDKPREFMIESM